MSNFRGAAPQQGQQQHAPRGSSDRAAGWIKAHPLKFAGAALALILIGLIVIPLGARGGDGNEEAGPVASPASSSGAPESSDSDHVPGSESEPEEGAPALSSQEWQALIAERFGYASLNAGCGEGVTWMCPITEVELKAGTLVINFQGGVDPRRIGIAVFNVLCGSEFGIDRVQAMDDTTGENEIYPSAVSDPPSEKLCSAVGR